MWITIRLAKRKPQKLSFETWRVVTGPERKKAVQIFFSQILGRWRLKEEKEVHHFPSFQEGIMKIQTTKQITNSKRPIYPNHQNTTEHKTKAILVQKWQNVGSDPCSYYIRFRYPCLTSVVNRHSPDKPGCELRLTLYVWFVTHIVSR